MKREVLPLLLVLALAVLGHADAQNRICPTISELTEQKIKEYEATPSCEAENQRLALQQFYSNTGGPFWFNNSGWTLELGPATTGSCKVNGIVFPDHCCWFGVDCCRGLSCDSNSNTDNRIRITCMCFVGTVVALHLNSNNLSGNIDFDNWWPVFNYSSAENSVIGRADGPLACNLRELDLQNNFIHGTLPAKLTALSELRRLGLGYNDLSGTIPLSISKMSNLELLELTDNKFTGTVPGDICTDNYDHPLTDLLIGLNNLTGGLDLRYCVNLVMIDAQSNKLDDTLYIYPDQVPILHIIQLSSNNLRGSLPQNLTGANLISILDMSDNELSGTLPPYLEDLRYLTNLQLDGNLLSGSVPGSIFSTLVTLNYAAFSYNKFTGTIPPEIAFARGLVMVEMAANALIGTIPGELVPVLGSPSKIFDVRYNFLSCCGQDFVYNDDRTYGTYSSFNMSMPRLPPGIVFSDTLRTVTSRWGGASELR